MKIWDLFSWKFAFMRLSVTALVSRNLGGHCPSDVNIRALMRPKFNLRLERCTGSPVSAAGGMPSAMLAGLADRLPHRRFVRFFSLWYIPQLAPRCATIAFNGSGGVAIPFSLWRRQKGCPFRLFRRHSIRTVAVPLGNVAFPVRQAVLSGAFCACFG